MNQIIKLRAYCETMLIKFDIEEDSIEINDKIYKIVTDDTQTLFDEDFESAISDSEVEDDGYIYEFAGRWYTQNKGESVSLDELCYIGEPNIKIPTESFLGMRSGYELMNGMGLYKTWVKKAKFLGVKALGVCEKNTLSGALEFQNECVANGIKSILGITVEVVEGKSTSDVKLYAKNFQGWLQLLKFNTAINVEGKLNVTIDFLSENHSDLVVVLDPKSADYSSSGELIKIADFYQLETVNFSSIDRHDEFIYNQSMFLKSDLPPISITDAYYLEESEFTTREVLWSINKSFYEKTTNQFFKTKCQYKEELKQSFDGDSWILHYDTAIQNEKMLVDECNFIYDTESRHLPKYQMTKEEKEKHGTSENLFNHLISEGLKNRGIGDEKKYIDRLAKEIEVLKMGDVIDYFLDLYNVIGYARSKGYLVGIGRGSAGGSLVAYLLGIIQIDPLEFDLLFERFLNSGRMGSFEDKPAFELTLEDGSKMKFLEGSILKVRRQGKEIGVLIHETIEGDELIKY